MIQSISDSERAQVLVDALPHIKKYTGQTVVVKYGGHAMTSEKLKEQVMGDIVLLHLIGVRVVLVHGGGPEINHMLDRVGKESMFHDGLRVTDKETLEVVQMVLAGKINKTLVSLLAEKGGNAVGLSGVDGGMIRVKEKSPKLGYVGDITHVNVKPIEDLLEGGYIPVISTMGCGASGDIYNINGDTAAAYIAGALNAECLIMMTDVPGIFMDENDPDSLLAEITVKEARMLKRKGIISGGMIPKVDCCALALKEGTNHVVIMDGTVPHAIIMELLTYEGAGTYIKRSASPIE